MGQAQGTTIDAALHRAMALAQGGALDAAEALLAQLRAAAPDQPDALHLSGLVARRRGDHGAAVDWFRRSLAVRPGQPDVLSNLGNSLRDLGCEEEAITAYRDALTLRPDHRDARANLATTLLARGDAIGAREVAAALPDDPRTLATLGEAQRRLGELPAAIDSFGRSLARRPGHVPTLHNLAVALRLAGRADEALPILDRCAATMPDNPAIHLNLGHCLQDLGAIDDATAAYRRVIALYSGDRDAHAALNRMLWRHGRTAEHLASYRAALAADPGDSGLRADLAQQLTLTGRAAEAAALLAGQPGVDIAHRHGQALWALGQPDAALARYAGALAIDPAHAPTRREAARAQIILDRPADALATIAPLLDADPADQQALALRELGWRLIGDRRAEWLADPRLIGAERLPVSPGFNAVLDRALDPLHAADRAPLDQTLRGGTQTTDDLFARPIPAIAAARTLIAEGVARYIARLPDDPAHPFLSRRRARFDFAGSWSVRLRSAGFHENHLHPEGWISAVYYVAVPPAVDDGEQGWLTFGESGLRLGRRERSLRRIRPEPGLLVLFPSYFYHGTLPFADDRHRTTIAFDIVPAD